MAAACLSEKMNLMASKRQKRREKSRDAARFRRHKESNTFDDICSIIPVPQDVLNHLDKSAIMRMLISYIKLRQVMNGRNQETRACCRKIAPKQSSLNLALPPPYKHLVKKEMASEDSMLSDDDYVNSLNGFLLVLSSEHDVLYVSDNVKDYLGLSKFDLMGQSIFQYTHEGDHDDLKTCFTQNSENTSIFLRLKSTLTVNGRNINLKSASYKVLRCSGVVRQGAEESSYMIAHVEPLPHPANIEHLLDCTTFVSQHSPDMKFTYCDEKFSNLLGYSESDLMDRSFFDFCHVADMKSIGDYFHKLYRLNQVETNLYRFLAKTGGYLWMVTQATVITNQKSHKPQCIVCVHYVISGMEHKDVPLSSEQLGHCLPVSCEPVENNDVKNKSEAEKLDEILVDSDVAPYNEEDDCSFVPLTFADLDESDGFISEELCFNAPSIGDPWTFSESAFETDGSIEDVLGDALPPAAKQTAQKITYNPQTIDELPPLNSQPENLPTWRSLPMEDLPTWKNSPVYSTSVGCASPCDSAYCSNPPSPDAFTSYGTYAACEKPSSSCSPFHGSSSTSWQSVGVPSEQYARHISNLKRGHLRMEDPDLASWLATKAKKRCMDPSMNSASGGNSSLELDVSILLQPELNFNSKLGSKMVRNLSSGFLPELSVHDCEVNAPLFDVRVPVPLAVDCVHLLDSDS